MKRLILMGGRPWLARDGGQEFVETLLRDNAPEVRLGMCIFAQPESDWEETRTINATTIAKFARNTPVTIKVMTSDNFREVSEWANVIYIPGGTTATLKERLASFDIAVFWNGKTIAGSSAGAHLLCKKSVYLQDRTVVKGLGWVDVNVIVHWRSDFAGFTDNDWDWAEQTLVSEDSAPLICLPESKFVEVTIA